MDLDRQVGGWKVSERRRLSEENLLYEMLKRWNTNATRLEGRQPIGRKAERKRACGRVIRIAAYLVDAG